jgi:hypothetical protein
MVFKMLAKRCPTSDMSQERKDLGAEFKRVAGSGELASEDMQRERIRLTVQDGVDADEMYQHMQALHQSPDPFAYFMEHNLGDKFNEVRMVEFFLAAMPDMATDRELGGESRYRTQRAVSKPCKQ